MDLKQKFLLFFLVGFVGLYSQAKFYVKGKSQAFVGQTYAITFVLENGKGKIRVPQSYPGFEIIGGPSQSSNYSWVNGKSTSSISYTYYLQATKEGVFTIPKASVELKNESLTTKALRVTVKKGSVKSTNNTNSNRNRNTPQQTTADNGDWKEQVKKNLFVKMYVDKSNPYVGEQVTLYLKLFQRVQTFQTQVLEMPEFNGFWVKDFELRPTKWEKEEIDGVWYNTMLINKYALFPQRAGEFKLSAIKLETVVQIKSKNRGRSIWEQFFGSYESKRYPFQSNGLTIKVKDLPIEGVPENFSGAVGKFKYSATIDSINVETGSAITLKTKIVGTGNIMMIDAPKIVLPKEFEVYDPQEKEYISKKSTYINGSKKYDYLMIPNKPGEFQIDSIPFSYFDLATKKYRTIYSDGFKVSVRPSADYVEEELVETNGVDALGTDIKNISSIYDLDYREDKFISSYTFWMLWASPVLVFLFLLIGKNKIENYNPDIVAKNRKKANKMALQKLKQASVFLEKNDKKSFYDELVRALWNYVSMKLNMKAEDLSKEKIQEKLVAQNVSEATADSFIELIDKSELVIYSPVGEAEMQEDFDKAKEIFINVENELQ